MRHACFTYSDPYTIVNLSIDNLGISRNTRLKQGDLLTGRLTGATYIFEKYDRTEDRLSIWGYSRAWNRWPRHSYGGYDGYMFSVSKYIDINKLELSIMVEAL